MRAAGGDVDAHLHDVAVRQVDGRVAMSSTAHGRVTSNGRPPRVAALRHHGVLVARRTEPARHRHRAVPAAAAAAACRRTAAPGRRPVLLAAAGGRRDVGAGREGRRRDGEVEQGDVDALVPLDADDPRARRTAHAGLERHGARQQTLADAVEDHRRRRAGVGRTRARTVHVRVHCTQSRQSSNASRAPNRVRTKNFLGFYIFLLSIILIY